MNRLKKKSKGSMFDVLLIIITVVVMGMIIMVGNTVLQHVYDATNDSQVINTTYIQRGQTALRVYDTMMPFIILGLVLTSVVLAFLIPTHPIFIIPAIFALTLIVMMSAQFTNMYSRIEAVDALNAEGEQLTTTNQIISNLPLLALVVGIVIMAAMFISSKQGGFAGG